MGFSMHDTVAVVHNRVPGRLRLMVPMIKHKQTFGEMLKHGLLKDADARGVYHVEPKLITGTLLVKYHPALHSEQEIVELVSRVAGSIALGTIEISAKHKNPRLGKMRPGAFFTRELLVSIGGNVIAGLILAAVLTG